MAVHPSPRTLPAPQQSIHPGLLFFVSSKHEQHVKQPQPTSQPALCAWCPWAWFMRCNRSRNRQRVLHNTHLSAFLIISFTTNRKWRQTGTPCSPAEGGRGCWGCKGTMDGHEKLGVNTEAHVDFRENLNLLPLNYYDTYICRFSISKLLNEFPV